MNTEKLFRALYLALFAVAVIGVSGLAGQSASSASKPTIVLVHGAFTDGSSWQQVVSLLQRDRYNVVAVQTPLTSLAADVQAVKRVLNAQTGPVVLVGHSWGGAVITEAGASDKHVKALVYIAAFAPDAGEVVSALGDKYPTRLGSALRPDEAGYLTVDPTQFHELFGKDLDPALTRVAAATQKPIIGSAFGETVSQAAWKSIPAWDIVTLDDQALHPDLQRFYAKRMNATTTEIKSSHMVVLSHAAEVARVIEQAAEATGRGQ